MKIKKCVHRFSGYFQVIWTGYFPLDFHALKEDLGAEFYKRDALTDANRQKHSGLHLFCIHCDC